jgi:hypothetical protein
LRVYKEFRPPASLDPTGDPLELIKSPDETDVQARERMRNVYAWNLGWKESVHEKKIVGNAGNEIVSSVLTLLYLLLTTDPLLPGSRKRESYTPTLASP